MLLLILLPNSVSRWLQSWKGRCSAHLAVSSVSSLSNHIDLCGQFLVIEIINIIISIQMSAVKVFILCITVLEIMGTGCVWAEKRLWPWKYMHEIAFVIWCSYLCWACCVSLGITSTVKNALQESCIQILSPQGRVDILRDVKECREQRRPYVVTFCGVNGVGKSTNLAKVGTAVLV